MRVVVVGSGIVGASCAYTACSLGAEVVLADAALPGTATAAGAGIVCPWWSELADDPVWYGFACAAARYYPELAAELAGLGAADIGYQQVGALILERPGEQQSVLELFLARRAGAPEIGAVEALTGDEASGLFPVLGTERAAVFLGGACRVDGRLVAAALARAAADKGAVIMTGRAELVRRSGRAAGVTLGGGLVEGDAVVAAAGAWTNSFLPPGVVTVEPQRGQIAHFSVEPADTSGWPLVLPAGSGHYLLAFDDHRVVAGATRETGSGFDYRVTAAGMSQVLSEMLAVAPGLSAATYLETRVGFRPMSPDGLPVLGPVPGTDGLVAATGLGPTGLTLGPYAGAIAARVALGEPPGFDLAPFSPLRSARPGGSPTARGAPG
jgi:D-amino-acid dehydrogenase